MVGCSPHSGQVGSRATLTVVKRVDKASNSTSRPDERVAEAEQLLQHLGRLERADRARDRAEDAGLGAARHQIGRRRLAEDAAIARVRRAQMRLEGRKLALEAQQRRRHQGLAGEIAGVVKR